MYNYLHLANITAHATLGVAALALGLWVLFRPKGDRAHRSIGRVFAALMFGVVATASIGFAFFRQDPTLGAITLLVTYQLISGLRAARGRAPMAFDITLSIAALAMGAGFLLYLLSGASAYWRPQVTFPIAVTLVLIAAYDLIRLAAPRWRSQIYPLEHGVKMIMALGALASAGAGTVLAAWQPLSQIGPSVLFSLVAVGYVVLRGRTVLRSPRTP